MRAAFLLALSGLCIASATSAEETTLTPRQQEGKSLFESTCVYCHNARGWGTERLRARKPTNEAVLTQRTDLDATFIRAVVRNGFLTMPAFTPTDLSEAQIQAIADYLTRTR